MSALDQVVSINISRQTQAVPQASFSVPAVFGPSNRFAATSGITGTTVSGSPNISALSSITGVNPGASVSGTGIPSGTYVLSVSGTTAVLSANATASASGVTLNFTDAIRAYTGVSGMVSDGFLVTDAEYIRAAALLAGSITPNIFYVGRYSAAVAQTTAITVNSLTGIPGHVYQFTFNGTVISYTSITSDSYSNVINGLNTAFAAAILSTVATAAVSGSGSSTTLTITSAVAGLAFTITAVDSELTNTAGTANHTITTDITQAQQQNDSWYGLAICSNVDGDILQAAAFTESLKKIFIPVSSGNSIATSSSTDLGSVLKGKSYNRTALVFSLVSYNTGIECAWMGGQLPQVPGSNNWAFKTLPGQSVDTLTPTQQVNCIGVPEAGTVGKNVNIYQTVGGVNITQMGTMASGQFIDITIGLDWLQSTIQTNIFAQLVNLPKIPYTDKGTNILIQAVKSAIDQGVINGLIDGASAITITALPVAQVPQNQRALRIAPTINFTCRLQGAFNAVLVNGTVTV